MASPTEFLRCISAKKYFWLLFLWTFLRVSYGALRPKIVLAPMVTMVPLAYGSFGFPMVPLGFRLKSRSGSLGSYGPSAPSLWSRRFCGSFLLLVVMVPIVPMVPIVGLFRWLVFAPSPCSSYGPYGFYGLAVVRPLCSWPHMVPLASGPFSPSHPVTPVVFYPVFLVARNITIACFMSLWLEASIVNCAFAE